MTCFLTSAAIFLVSLTLFNIASCYKELHISSIHGSDSYGCGKSSSQQCHTLQYTIQNIPGNEIVLYLDGGESQQIYTITSPLELGNVSMLIIKMQTGSKEVPVISNTIGSSMDLFSFGQGNAIQKTITIRLEFIKLHNINIFQTEERNIDIAINKCIIINPLSRVPRKKQSNLGNLQIINSYIRCRNTRLISEENQDVSFKEILIRNSTINGCSIFLNSTSTITLKLEIENTAFSGNIDTSFVYVTRTSNVVLNKINFSYSNGVDRSIRALFKMTSQYRLRSKISFYDITFQGNHNTGLLCHIENSYIDGSQLTMENNTNSSGVVFNNVSGRVARISITRNFNFSSALTTRHSIVDFGKIIVNKNYNVNTTIIISTSSVKSIDSIEVKDTVYRNKHHAVFLSSSHVNISLVNIENCTIQSADGIGLRNGNVVIYSLIIKHNTMHQILLQIGGSLVVKSGTIHNNNNSLSTSIGSADAELLDFGSVSFKDNMVGDKLLHVENVNWGIFRQIDVFNNTVNAVFHLLKGNIIIDGVSIKNSIARKHGKALSFTDELSTSRRSFNVTIQNFHAYFDRFTGTYETDNYFEIDVRDSTLTIQNTTVVVQEVFVPSLKILKLIFATKNPNVHPQINVLCPVHYDVNPLPKVTEATIEYVVNCQRCPKDSYTLLRGQLQLKDIVNNSKIDTSWVKPHNISAIISTERKAPLQCFSCPPGGNCLNGTRSQGNFYGYKINKTNLGFISCPSQYCCSNQGKECTSYNTCNYNRRGLLCGQCHDGFYESIFSQKCIPNQHCTKEKQYTFWAFFVLLAIVLAFSICFFKDILMICKHLFLKLKAVIQKRKGGFKCHSACNRNDASPVQGIESGKIVNKVFRIPTKYYNLSLAVPGTDTCNTDHLKQFPSSNWFFHSGRYFKNECFKTQSSKPYTIAGVIQIIVTFFQIDSLATVKLEEGPSSKKSYDFVSGIFNLKLVLANADDHCPFHSITAVQKLLIQKLMLLLSVIVVIIVCLLVIWSLKSLYHALLCICNKDSNFHNELTSLPTRYKVAFASFRVIMLGYKNIAFVSITLMSCPYVNNIPVLYIDGSIRCYQEHWQIFNYIFFAVWVIPFPLVLPFLYDSIKKGAIHLWDFLLCLTIPLATPIVLFWKKKQRLFFLDQCDDKDNNNTSTNIKNQRFKIDRALRMHLFEIFEEPYSNGRTGALFWWVTFCLYERLIIVVISTLITDPTKRLCTITMVTSLFLWLHVHLKPYKKEMSLLSVLDVTSYICLSFHCTMNTFRAVVYTFDIPSVTNPVAEVLDIFGGFGYVITPLTVFFIYFCLKGISSLHEVISSKKKE